MISYFESLWTKTSCHVRDTLQTKLIFFKQKGPFKIIESGTARDNWLGSCEVVPVLVLLSITETH